MAKLMTWDTLEAHEVNFQTTFLKKKKNKSLRKQNAVT